MVLDIESCGMCLPYREYYVNGDCCATLVTGQHMEEGSSKKGSAPSSETFNDDGVETNPNGLA